LTYSPKWIIPLWIMPWLAPPYPPGFQLPGIGYFLLIGAVVLCFIGIAAYLAAATSAATTQSCRIHPDHADVEQDDVEQDQDQDQDQEASR
jgi:hypothetical protein